MFLSDHLALYLKQIFRQKGVRNGDFEVLSIVSGGDINFCCKLKAGAGFYFLKFNYLKKYPDMLFKEGQGLKLIANSGSINTPDVVATGAVVDEQFLLLEWITSGDKTAKKSQRLLGERLAEMHKNTHESFGLEFDNYMGSLKQTNTFCNNFTEFFIMNRLEIQLKIAFDNKLVNSDLYLKFKQIFTKFDELYPTEDPALVHGDLWSGNYLAGLNQQPVLIDPAVSYSHREIDIAMTTLFGGFSSEFYQAYTDVFPLAPEWQERCFLWNLYPLLIHLNLFGQSYIPQLKANLQKFI
ncbi:phosphotransferase [Pedobacter sp. HMF7647]|uniref:Phosphotransferase n=1 Tax=Hufsiella arboris TaxID=2695275 RepID=A0A7K1Y7W1_9SPHI|nr:fructosamine kinase family protein [Hufsiella arboris]MXV50657.1 phosphotransferase [Hufsiella arboris]